MIDENINYVVLTFSAATAYFIWVIIMAPQVIAPLQEVLKPLAGGNDIIAISNITMALIKYGLLFLITLPLIVKLFLTIFRTERVE